MSLRRWLRRFGGKVKQIFRLPCGSSCILHLLRLYNRYITRYVVVHDTDFEVEEEHKFLQATDFHCHMRQRCLGREEFKVNNCMLESLEAQIFGGKPPETPHAMISNDGCFLFWPFHPTSLFVSRRKQPTERSEEFRGGVAASAYQCSFR